MRPILLTIALALLLTAPCKAPAQDTRYRVEVIVLTHLGHTETPRDVASVRDYGDALDFLTPDEPAADDDAETDGTDSETEADTAALDTAPPGAEPTNGNAEPEPPDVVHIEELGDVMQDAWRRLRLSGPFRPLLSLAWEQADTPPFPLLRVHDENVVMTQDPWAPIRGRLEAGEPVDAWLEAGLVPPIPPPDPDADPDAEGPAMGGPDADPTRGADGVDSTPEAALLERLPPPRRFYALDGTVSLVRSRFLHFRVDLQQREGVYEAAPAQPVVLPRGLGVPPAATPEPEFEAAGVEPPPTAFRVFDMEQSRQVKTGQIEYFDGPVLSVLAYVTAIEPESGTNRSP